ncbi:hypothetical protein [Salipaludibacillus neizhouensis]|uniref:hypothetical protein n=1 Tax=Salipaludibacillus neizhouensis TaxID=885475 RepID=UPI001603AAFA|nr:hypothetical protein [Salipaludibacillus neizhouensis]
MKKNKVTSIYNKFSLSELIASQSRERNEKYERITVKGIELNKRTTALLNKKME